MVTSLAMLACMATGEPSAPCTKPDNGDRYFVSDKQQCDRFHMCDEMGNLAAELLCIDCSSGVERLVTSQNHLVDDDATGDCEHTAAANRKGCEAEELYEFNCPDTVSQSRHAAKSDCRAFFTCAIYTEYHPRLGGCPCIMMAGRQYPGVNQSSYQGRSI